MNLRAWFKRPIKLTDGAFWASFFGASTWTGKSVSATDALKLSVWFRIVKLHAEVTGALPFKVYERKGDDRVQVRDHPVALLTGVDPNSDQTTVEFWGAHAASLVSFGNAYAEKRFMGGRLVSLEIMPFEDTRPTRENPARVLQYEFTDRGKREVLPVDKVLHTRGWGYGRDLGLSPIAFARESIGGALAVEETAARLYGTGLRATGMFSQPPGNPLTPEQIKDFFKNYVSKLEGPEGEGKQLLLPPGFDHKSLNIAPKDAEMLLSRRFSVEDVCRWGGTPPILVGHAAEGQTMWGSGVENILLSWLTLGYNSFLRSIEASVNKRLFSAVDRLRFFAEFDRDAFMQADSAARAEFMSKMIQSGLRVINEMRRKDNLPPVAGGDQALINSTLVPLLQAGQRPARVQPKPGDPIPEAA